MQYGHQSDTLSAARRCLMLPHTRGVEQSIADAFRECSLAFHRMDESGLDDNARDWIEKIKKLMDISGQGTLAVKTQSFTTDQQLELSRIIDELAHWFDRKSWEERTSGI